MVQLVLSNLFKVTSLFLLFSLFIFILKLVIKRRKYSKLLPSRSQRLIDLKGDGRTFPSDASNSYSLTTYLLQFVSGFFYMFKEKPLFCAWTSYMPFVGLVKPEVIEEILSGTKVDQKAWTYNWIQCWLGTGLLTSHGLKWKTRRKIITPAFHFNILKDFLPIINEKAMQLVKKLEKETDKEYTSIVEPLTLCSLDIICETTLGVNINAQGNEESTYVKAVARVSDGLMKRILRFSSWFDVTFFLTYGRALKKDLKLLHEFTMSVIQKKKTELLSKDNSDVRKNVKRKPLMDILLQHHLNYNDLSEEGIREEVDTFTFEGHDTTSMAMTWALYLIGLYSDVQAKIHEELDRIFENNTERAITVDDLREMKYLECVLKESLRLYPPVPLFGRTVDKDITISGYPIPKGAALFIMPYQLHRDPDIYPNPEIFDPSRFLPENSVNRHPYAYLPFAAGSRNCIGQKFAMMEVKTVVANILRNYKLTSLDPRDKVVTAIEVVLRPTKPVRIRIRPRNLK